MKYLSVILLVLLTTILAGCAGDVVGQATKAIDTTKIQTNVTVLAAPSQTGAYLTFGGKALAQNNSGMGLVQVSFASCQAQNATFFSTASYSQTDAYGFALDSQFIRRFSLNESRNLNGSLSVFKDFNTTVNGNCRIHTFNFTVNATRVGYYVLDTVYTLNGVNTTEKKTYNLSVITKAAPPRANITSVNASRVNAKFDVYLTQAGVNVSRNSNPSPRAQVTLHTCEPFTTQYTITTAYRPTDANGVPTSAEHIRTFGLNENIKNNIPEFTTTTAGACKTYTFNTSINLSRRGYYVLEAFYSNFTNGQQQIIKQVATYNVSVNTTAPTVAPVTRKITSTQAQAKFNVSFVDAQNRTVANTTTVLQAFPRVTSCMPTLQNISIMASAKNATGSNQFLRTYYVQEGAQFTAATERYKTYANATIDGCRVYTFNQAINLTQKATYQLESFYMYRDAANATIIVFNTTQTTVR